MTSENPYDTPAAELEPDPDDRQFNLAEKARSNSIGHGWTWIVEGFEYFAKSWGAWILAMLLGLVIMVVVSLIPIVNLLFEFLTPYVWIAGIALGCRAQARGLPFRVSHLWAGFTNRVGTLILLALVFNGAVLALLAAVLGPELLLFIDEGSAAAVNLDPAVFMLRFLLAMLIIIPLVMTTFFAPHLIVFHDLPLFRAMKLSFVGCLKNVLPFLWWGIVMLVLTIAAMVPVGLGLLIMVPVSFASIYAAYEDIYLEP